MPCNYFLELPFADNEVPSLFELCLRMTPGKEVAHSAIRDDRFVKKIPFLRELENAIYPINCMLTTGEYEESKISDSDLCFCKTMVSWNPKDFQIEWILVSRSKFYGDDEPLTNPWLAIND